MYPTIDPLTGATSPWTDLGHPSGVPNPNPSIASPIYPYGVPAGGIRDSVWPKSLAHNKATPASQPQGVMNPYGVGVAANAVAAARMSQELVKAQLSGTTLARNVPQWRGVGVQPIAPGPPPGGYPSAFSAFTGFLAPQQSQVPGRVPQPAPYRTSAGESRPPGLPHYDSAQLG